MDFPISAVSSALQGLRLYGQRAAQAAGKIARAGLNEAPVAPATDSSAAPANPAPFGDPETADSTDLAAAMTDMMIAQRAYSAQLRVLETANEMAQETVNLGRAGRGSGTSS